MIRGKNKFKLRKKKKTLRCRELENEVRFQINFFCFALPFSISCDFNEILMKMVMQNKKILIEPLLYFSILYNVMFFFRSLNFFFPLIIFVIDRKFVLFKLFTAVFFIVNCTIVIQ